MESLATEPKLEYFGAIPTISLAINLLATGSAK